MEELHRYDLILLDIMMPGIDGFELCKKIRTLVDCPILFLTAKTEENSLVNGLSLGADDYISKPFGVMELRARIHAHLRREHREQVFSKEQILEKVFGFDSESNDSTIITHIKNIRSKFAEYNYTPIKTVWGIGYKWEE